MQYLSRAYQYYSGINPATLTGAIDVIVVKKTDENGEVTYSSSPFHVRFGKLQVLRAGEKKVTLHLPNNLPEPHVAPFWMKVGEAGEAFFVVETENEVPEELQTSPVISAADNEILPPQPSDADFVNGHAPESGDGQELRLTQEPFGAKDARPPKLDDAHTVPTFLDLNAPDNKDESRSREPDMLPKHKDDVGRQATSSRSTTPGGILSTASALVPSFLHSSSAVAVASTEGKSTSTSASDGKIPQKDKQDDLPPNPLAADANSPERPHHAETIQHYVRDHKRRLSKRLSANGADEALPKVKHGEGEPPNILYKDELVLDMAGYHQAPEERSVGRSEDSADDNQQRSHPKSPIRSASDGIDLYETREVMADITAGHDRKGKAQLIAFAQDLLASAGSSPSDLTGVWSGKAVATAAQSQQALSQEIERRFSQLDLSERKPKRTHTAIVKDEEDRRRGASEPPPDLETEGITNGEVPPPPYGAASDYTWEWGGFPTKTPMPRDHAFFEPNPAAEEPKARPAPMPISVAPERSNSAPVPSESLLVSLGDKGDRSKRRPGIPRVTTEPSAVQPEPAVESKPRGGGHKNALAQPLGRPGKLKNIEEDPYKFVLDMGHATHTFEMSLNKNLPEDPSNDSSSAIRITFQRFIEDPKIVESEDLVLHFENFDLTWENAQFVLASLVIYRKSLVPPSAVPPHVERLPSLNDIGVNAGEVPSATSRGYGWSRWWRRTPLPSPAPPTPALAGEKEEEPPLEKAEITPPEAEAPAADEDHRKVYYAKTLRLTSDQLKQLNLKDGANTITFSVTSSYSGQASCTARIFLWDANDQIVISDIDGTITKSDALGHVFAAIGRDWTHLGVAKLYTDITNNGYKMMYLTSRAIGQADSTRDYLKGIHQGNYQLPDGPVIMSPDRLMASLHREVIMRKPEIFKMACLRDIQRLFGRNAFYAGFGNRITDAMSYRSVNVPSSRIFTIDSDGEVKMELLELAGYKSSYIHMTDLVDQMFPPIHRKFAPEFTDFNYWRESIPDIPIPDLAPPSPALSARSDGSGRLSVLRNLTGIGRRSSRQSIQSGSTMQAKSGADMHSSRPSSPLVGPSITAEPDTDFVSEDEDFWDERRSRQGSSMPGSLPGSYDERADYLSDDFFDRKNDEPRYDHEEHADHEEAGGSHEGMDGQDDDVEMGMFEDDLEQMSKVPF